MAKLSLSDLFEKLLDKKDDPDREAKSKERDKRLKQGMKTLRDQRTLRDLKKRQKERDK